MSKCTKCTIFMFVIVWFWTARVSSSLLVCMASYFYHTVAIHQSFKYVANIFRSPGKMIELPSLSSEDISCTCHDFQTLFSLSIGHPTVAK